MEKIYFTITGTKHYFGNDFLKPDMIVGLKRNLTTIMTRKPSRWNLKALALSVMLPTVLLQFQARAIVPADSMTKSEIQQKEQ